MRTGRPPRGQPALQTSLGVPTMNCYHHYSPSYCMSHCRAQGWLAILGLLLACCGTPTPVNAQISTLQSGPLGVVLLKNDRVLQGDVERRGDFYHVEIANQSAVTLPIAQVESVGQSIKDIYIYKLRSVSRWSAGDHFKLTRWCIVNNLLDEAALHYQEVAKEAGDHPRVKQLAIELKNQMLRDPEFRAYLGLSAAEPSLGEAGEIQSSPSKSAVVSASANMRVVQHPQIVQHFSERIQPILINRCSQAACHGSQSSNQLQLLEPYARASLETSSKNLASVLSQITENSDSALTPAVLRHASTWNPAQASHCRYRNRIGHGTAKLDFLRPKSGSQRPGFRSPSQRDRDSSDGYCPCWLGKSTTGATRCQQLETSTQDG